MQCMLIFNHPVYLVVKIEKFNCLVVSEAQIKEKYEKCYLN